MAQRRISVDTYYEREQQRNNQIGHIVNTINMDSNDNKQKYKSPSTKARSWRRAIAWRQQIGLAIDEEQEKTKSPSASPTLAIKNKYFEVTDYLDDMTAQGTLDYLVARELKHKFFEWATFEMCLMNRVEEVEEELLNMEFACENTVNVNTSCDDISIVNHSAYNCVTNQVYKNNFKTNKISPKSKNQTEYDTKKCRKYITPVKFVSGGFANANNIDINDVMTRPKVLLTPELENAETKAATSSLVTQNTTTNSEQLKTTTNTNWSTIDYDRLEEDLRLCRLEDKDNFQTAQRLVIRLTHPQGDKICYPTTEQTDRMLLRAVNLPTDARELCDLMRKACTRRSEGLNLDKIYKDLVRAHGRVLFDHTKTTPHCYVFTKCP